MCVSVCGTGGSYFNSLSVSDASYNACVQFTEHVSLQINLPKSKILGIWETPREIYFDIFWSVFAEEGKTEKAWYTTPVQSRNVHSWLIIHHYNLKSGWGFFVQHLDLTFTDGKWRLFEGLLPSGQCFGPTGHANVPTAFEPKWRELGLRVKCLSDMLRSSRRCKEASIIYSYCLKRWVPQSLSGWLELACWVLSVTLVPRLFSLLSPSSGKQMSRWDNDTPTSGL